MKLDCGHEESPHSNFTTGYGYDENKKTFCYECCAKNDKKFMDEKGKYSLYLVKREDGYHVTNWPGTLDYKVKYYSLGHHNFGGHRIDVWFSDHQNKSWHGVQIGQWNDVCHVKKIKKFPA